MEDAHGRSRPHLQLTRIRIRKDSDTIEYYKVSDRRYAIVENGQLMGLALSDTVDLAMQDLELLNAGETVPDPN